MRNREEILKNIEQFFEDNTDIFTDCIEELDSYNGYLGDDRYYDMDELDEFYHDVDATELLSRAFYGHDEEAWTTREDGSREYGAFNPNRDYFRYNGYGNLLSADYKDYSDHIDIYAIEQMAQNRCEINSIDNDAELCALFDELEEAENEEE